MGLKLQRSEGKTAEQEKEIKTAKTTKSTGLIEYKQKKSESAEKEQVVTNKKINEEYTPIPTQKANLQSESNRGKDKEKNEKAGVKVKFPEKKAEDSKSPIQNSTPSQK